VNLTAGVCFISFDDMHYSHVAHKHDEHDYIENEFGCHGPVIDFDLTYAQGNSSQNQFF
jgi:hypothetical protein